MNSKPKIVVLRMREIIYTFLLILLVILLLVCLFLMFSPGHSSGGGQTETTEQQTPLTTETPQSAGGQSETGTLTSDNQNATGALTSDRQSTAGTLTSDDRSTAGTQATNSQNAADTQNTNQKAGADQADTGRTDGTAVQTSTSASFPVAFTPGVYTVPVFLNDATVDVEVTVDADHINAIRLVNLSETVETMYPLMTPALENITSQILQRQTLEGITCPQENRYTSQLLLNAVSDALDIARAD